jgi:peroxin-10
VRCLIVLATRKADNGAVRANQRDLFHVASLREQAESVLRSWLGALLYSFYATGADDEWKGTRWLTRWDKEVELAVKLMYYGLYVGRGILYLLRGFTLY